MSPQFALTTTSFHRTYLAIGYGLVLLIVAGSLLPMPAVDLNLRHADKWQHLLAYLALALWFGALRPGWRQFMVVAAACTCLGLALELLQAGTPYRRFDLADASANALGGGVGALLGIGPGHRLRESVARWLGAVSGPAAPADPRC